MRFTTCLFFTAVFVCFLICSTQVALRFIDRSAEVEIQSMPSHCTYILPPELLEIPRHEKQSFDPYGRSSM